MKNYIEPTINITKFFKSDSILQASGDYAALQANQTLDQVGEYYHNQNMAGTSTLQATTQIIKLR